MVGVFWMVLVVACGLALFYRAWELVELKRGVRALEEAMWEKTEAITDFPYLLGMTAQPSDNP